MTENQVDALKKAHELLSEHFEAYILTVDAGVTDATSTQETQWYGGYARCVGLNTIGKSHLETQTTEDHYE